MTGCAVEWPGLERTVRAVLGTDRVVAAEAPELERALEMTF